MSAEEIPGREVAYRLFAATFDDATLSPTESDEERAPNYVITPTGARLNRVFVVGALTEVTAVNEDMLRARVVDPTGGFVVYAGQYQPEALAFLEQVEPPAFVAVTGKARTYSPDDADVVYTSIRPESISTVDADTRDRWVVSAAEQTLERVGTYAAAAEVDATGDALVDTLQEAGVEGGLAAGIPLAQDHYATTPAYLASVRDLALDSARVVAGKKAEVDGLDRTPTDADPGGPTFETLAAEIEVSLEVEDPGVGTADETGETTAATGVSGSEATVSEADATLQESDDSEAPEAGTEGGEVADIEAEEAEATDVEAEAHSESDDGAVEDEAETDDVAGTVDDEGEADLEGEQPAEEASGGMYEMDDEEREELEAEFGAEFSTGAEVDEPGEADIDVPPAASAARDDAETGASDSLEAEPGAGPDGPGDFETVSDSTADTADEDGTDVETDAHDGDDEAGDDESTGDDQDGEDELEDIDLQDRVVEVMGELDDGDGADREAIVETVVEETGADAEAVASAIEDALMGGQCYEPGDGKLKAI